ncbi:hypothetical protein [Clostridium beijerinckii]|uniref:Cupin superfamily acireductone dioxygenase involved in methionine salvage n=1 Tax=Clostridium beijerinckii TaxID=1520 RepID=A0AAE5H366_CLOBE|nr:hypothetical protein [Clostridium beijerinckii]NSB13952.1 cupin superfamily acireductone dioxygenase involved in methionine salvage [Clostridium beijerinckii]OOM34722.1 hypothetical protein CLOBE_00290 [Clostridium beijerinckii]
MHSKKIVAVLLTVGVVASTFAIFNQINMKGAFADTIKQNVVYSKEDTSSVSQDDGTGKITGDEEEAYKQKSLDILKEYFNIPSVEENEDFKFSACILNEKTLDVIKPKEQKAIQDSYDKKEISKEEYDKEMAYAEENDNGLKDRVAKLKHGMVQTGWVGINEDKCYMFDFNENTKEIDTVLVSEGYLDQSKPKLTISQEQLKNTAEDFIKQHKLGDVEKPKCILVAGENGHRLFYQDENDSSKKVEIFISPYTGKVDGFSIKAYADLEYSIEINETRLGTK